AGGPGRADGLRAVPPRERAREGAGAGRARRPDRPRPPHPEPRVLRVRRVGPRPGGRPLHPAPGAPGRLRAVPPQGGRRAGVGRGSVPHRPPRRPPRPRPPDAPRGPAGVRLSAPRLRRPLAWGGGVGASLGLLFALAVVS